MLRLWVLKAKRSFACCSIPGTKCYLPSAVLVSTSYRAYGGKCCPDPRFGSHKRSRLKRLRAWPRIRKTGTKTIVQTRLFQNQCVSSFSGNTLKARALDGDNDENDQSAPA